MTKNNQIEKLAKYKNFKSIFPNKKMCNELAFTVGRNPIYTVLVSFLGSELTRSLTHPYLFHTARPKTCYYPPREAQILGHQLICRFSATPLPPVTSLIKLGRTGSVKVFTSCFYFILNSFSYLLA